MRGRPFESGNKAGRGRPRGSKNRRTVFMNTLEEFGERIIRQCILLALKGDGPALRLCMERLVPPCQPVGQKFRLPAINSLADLGPAYRKVLEEIADGRLTARDGESLAGVLEKRRQLGETAELDARLQALEQRTEGELKQRENPMSFKTEPENQ